MLIAFEDFYFVMLCPVDLDRLLTCQSRLAARVRQQFVLYPPGGTDKNTQPNLEIPEEIPTHLS